MGSESIGHEPETKWAIDSEAMRLFNSTIDSEAMRAREIIVLVKSN